MKKRFVFSIFLFFWVFCGVVSFFGIFQIAYVNASKKVLVCIFESFSFLWILSLGIGKYLNPKMRTGFFVPLVIVDALNLVLVTILNMFVCNFLSNDLFLWIQMRCTEVQLQMQQASPI